MFHSFETGAGAEAVVRLIGAGLGGARFGSLPAKQQWTEAVRLFRRARVLLVWDNFESVLPAWRPGSAGCQPARQDAGEPRAGEPPALPSASAPPTASALASDLLADLQRLYRDLTDADNPKQVRGRLLVTCRPAETGLDGIAGLGLAGLARPDALHLLRGVYERREINRPGPNRSDPDGRQSPCRGRGPLCRGPRRRRADRRPGTARHLDTLVALAQAVYQHQAAAAAQPTAPVQPLPPDLAEALAQLTQLPPPLATFAAFLQVIATGRRPTPPRWISSPPNFCRP